MDNMLTNFSNINFLKGSDLSVFKDVNSKILNYFKDFGAKEVELPTLFNFEILLNLYGEDLRSRAFNINDPLTGEKILRPEFTVPMVIMHMNSKKKYEIYSYSGCVWRKQISSSSEKNEIPQVGIEIFHKKNSSMYDAKVFKLFFDIINFDSIELEIGDLGVLRSILDLIEISDYKKRILLKHIWRPKRFLNLIEKFSDNKLSLKSEKYLLDLKKLDQIKKSFDKGEKIFGLRTIDEIKERINLINEENYTLPINKKDKDLIIKVQSLSCKLDKAPCILESLFGKEKKFLESIDKLKERNEELINLKINIKDILFAVSHLRSGAEFYDGFTFGFFKKNDKNLPALAKGGRYDALTKIIRSGESLPSIGGMIRPDLYSDLVEKQ